VLEKIDETNRMWSIQTPKNVPRLFDLVKPKKTRFAHAFYKALHDMLVAQNLAQANCIAFGAHRWQVVTLVGELIDLSGMMSSGSAKPRGSGMRSTFVSDDEQDCASVIDGQCTTSRGHQRASGWGIQGAMHF